MKSCPSSVVRIGNAQAFWGDRSDAAAELLAQEPDLDYLTMDYLAEVSLSILAVQRERDPSAGYARDFVEVVSSLAPYWRGGGKCRLIVNAGGLNPRGCAEACRVALEKAGCPSRKIAVVSGDDVLSLLRAEPHQPSFRHLETGVELIDIADRLVTANAYVGASPIVSALQAGADIVITGRVADPSLVLAACVHHFGWSETDWNRLAGGTVAGHLIECGTQVTGGISTDWLSIPDPAHLGFPIVEVSEEGACVVTKPSASGGIVNEWTVKEQLLYEIGPHRVRVSGAQGRERPSTLKVSATYRDGYRAAGTLTILGADAEAKGKRCGDIVLQRLRESGFTFRDQLIECFPGEDHAVVRFAVEAESMPPVERFTREVMPLITAGPQGTTGYAEGRPRVHPIFRYWPCLVDRDRVVPRWEMWASQETVREEEELTTTEKLPPRFPREAKRGEGPPQDGTLRDIACGRSGDKGTGANVGVIARRPEDFPFLRDWLTVERVAEFFADDGVEDVVRYELPNLCALNFLLKGVLKRALRTDAQGKGLAQRLLRMRLPDRNP